MATSFHKQHSSPIDIARSSLRQDGVVNSETLTTKGASPASALAAMRRLRRSGEVVKVGRGVYQSVQRRQAVGRNPLIGLAGVMSDQPYYVSWRFALAHYGLTEQMPRRISVAVTSKRRPRVVADYDVDFVRVSPSRFGGDGVGPVMVSGYPVEMASPERAVLDSLDRPDLGGGLFEVVRALGSDRLDLDRLVRLAAASASDADGRRLGYIMEVIGVGDPAPLSERVGGGPYALLDSEGEVVGATVARWRVRDNVGPDVLRGWHLRAT